MAYRKPLTHEQLLQLQLEIAPLTRGFDLIADHVVITDVNGNILYANEGAMRHTGFSKDEMIGKNPGDLWGGHMDPKFYEDMWHMLTVLKMPFRGEVKNHDKEGSEYWQELRIFPVFDQHNEVRFLIGIEPDITWRKTDEEHQRQYREELEKLNQYLSEKKMTLAELAEGLEKHI
ncbi:MAG: PAS domain-containing protein [Candidatus Sungbacteria bacterium]|nr:PAS domain-containing protein [Candidatus Sungbacteria bacterium]